MKFRLIFFTTFILLPLSAMGEGFYCPQNHGFINTGMTQAQVINACGQPMSKLDSSNTKIEQKVPVKQLLYTHLNQGSVYPGLNPAFYDQWSLPSGSTGVGLQVDIINNKVSGVKLNGADTNALSVCGGNAIVIGDDELRVYTACGSPSMINNSFILKTIPASEKPEVWIYQQDQYSPIIRLTFVNGVLQFINK